MQENNQLLNATIIHKCTHFLIEFPVLDIAVVLASAIAYVILVMSTGSNVRKKKDLNGFATATNSLYQLLQYQSNPAVTITFANDDTSATVASVPRCLTPTLSLCLPPAVYLSPTSTFSPTPDILLLPFWGRCLPKFVNQRPCPAQPFFPFLPFLSVSRNPETIAARNCRSVPGCSDLCKNLRKMHCETAIGLLADWCTSIHLGKDYVRSSEGRRHLLSSHQSLAQCQCKCKIHVNQSQISLLRCLQHLDKQIARKPCSSLYCIASFAPTNLFLILVLTASS